MRTPRVLEHWLAFCGGRPARDGWQPSTRYRVVATALLLLVGVTIVRAVADDRGVPVAAALGALYFGGAWLIVSGRTAQTSRFAARHPYLDAAWSIPIAGVFAFGLLPENWPLGTVAAIAVAYVVLIYVGAWRSTRGRPRA